MTDATASESSAVSTASAAAPPSIPPVEWGPSVWAAIHWIAAGYPAEPTPDDKAQVLGFFGALGKVLPCHECRQHFQQMLVDHPVQEAYHSGKSLRTYAVHLHNLVTARTQGREAEAPWTLQDADLTYPPADDQDSTGPPALPDEKNPAPIKVKPKQPWKVTQANKLAMGTVQGKAPAAPKPKLRTLSRRTAYKTTQNIIAARNAARPLKRKCSGCKRQRPASIW